MLQERRVLINLFNTAPLTKPAICTGQGGSISIQIPQMAAGLAAWQGNPPHYGGQQISSPQKTLSPTFVPKILEYRFSLEGEPVTLKVQFMSKIQSNPGPVGQPMSIHIFEEHRKFLPENSLPTVW